MPEPDPLLLLRTSAAILSDTAEDELAAQIPALVSLLYGSRVLDTAIALCTSGSRPRAEEASVLCNKFKTRISALLQSRNQRARWCGVVLAKCSMESSFEALAGWGGVWVRLIVPLLVRPEPSSTLIFAIRTLTVVCTRLTESKPVLTREVVTPCLQAVFAGLLKLIRFSSEDPLLEALLCAALEALRDLLRAHPVTFRPFSQRASELCLDLLSSSVTGNVETLAREVWVSLYLCASSKKRDTSGATGGKSNAVAAEWGTRFEITLKESHNMLDVVYEPVVTEAGDWHFSGATDMGLRPVEGMLASTDRLLLLLRTLQSFFTLPSPSAVSVPVGPFFELITRILSVTTSCLPNPNIEKATREVLFTRLSDVHTACCNLVSVAAGRLGILIVPHIATLLELLEFVFTTNSAVRTSVYHLVSELLSLSGTGLPKESSDALHCFLCAVAEDLIPAQPPVQHHQKQQKEAHADTLLTSSQSATQPSSLTPPGVSAAASRLLEVSLRTLPADLIRTEVRTRLDRAAVFTQNRDALLASTMFPPPAAKASVLPHLIGSGVTLPVEAITRPRMPVVWTAPMKKDLPDSDEDTGEQTGAVAIGPEDEEMTDYAQGRKRPRLEPNREPEPERQSDSTPAPPVPSSLSQSVPPPVHPLAVEQAMLQPSPPATLSPLPAATAVSPEKHAPPALRSSSIPAVDVPHLQPIGSLAALQSVPPVLPSSDAGVSPVKAHPAPAPAGNAETDDRANTMRGDAAGGEDEDEEMDIPEIDMNPDTDSEDEE